MQTATRPHIPGLIMFEHFTIGRLTVIVNAMTGAIVAVQDAKTGCAAAFLYCQREIADAVHVASLAWHSTAEHV
jgi:hypothetical protein